MEPAVAAARPRGSSRAGQVPFADAFEELVERCRMLADLFRVVHDLAPNDPRLLAAIVREDEALSALARLPEEDALTRLHHFLLDAEARLLEIEGGVSRMVFGERFRPRDYDPVVLLHYAKALARRGTLVADRPSRVREVLGHLLLKNEDDGRVAIAEKADVDLALLYVLGVSTGVEEFRESATRFFTKASDRLRQAGTLDEIFTGGLYADIIGFEIALRERLLDPEVLFGSLRLATVLSNRIRELGQREGIAPDALFARMAKVRAELEALFGEGRTAPGAGPTAPFPVAEPFGPGTRRETAEDTEAKEGKRRSQSQARVELERRRVWAGRVRVGAWVSAVVGAVVAAITVHQMFFGRSSLGKDELQRLSPEIAEAYVSNERPRTLIGVLDASKWANSPKERRREIALQIRDRLPGEARVQNAVLRVGDRLAIQIEGSRLKYVE